jgi:hypothetical protein
MEIDFLLSKPDVSRRRNVIPIEVKSANDYTTFSLERFRLKFRDYVAVPVILHPGDLKMSNGIVSLPLYMASLVPECGAVRW